jgi:hypothetical protein
VLWPILPMSQVRHSFLNQVSKFGINAGYVERESPEYFEDVPDGIVYQCAQSATVGGIL